MYKRQYYARNVQNEYLVIPERKDGMVILETPKWNPIRQANFAASTKYPFYNAAYFKALPFIVELRQKSGQTEESELETCFEALYGILLPVSYTHLDVYKRQIHS